MTRHPGHLVAGRYSLVRPLARGGMGQLWVARDGRLDREVALKFIAEGGRHAADVERFEREARIAARLRSSHIVQVHDYGFDHDDPFIVMELLMGESLARVIARDAPMPPPLVASWLAQVGRGLKNAHEAGVVHRDIKPSNVFVAHEGDLRVLKLLDFGIAKTLGASGSELTRRDRLVGSPMYMSPEQLRGRPLDTRSDLWSVAVVAHEMLTGHVPSECGGPTPSGDGLGSDPDEGAPSRTLRLSSDLDGFFEVALAHDPGRRFQDVDSMLHALQRACATVPIAQPPKSSPGARGRDDATATLLPDEATLRGHLQPATSTPRASATTGWPASMGWAAALVVLALVPIVLRSGCYTPAPVSAGSSPSALAASEAPPPDPSSAGSASMHRPAASPEPSAPIEPSARATATSVEPHVPAPFTPPSRITTSSRAPAPSLGGPSAPKPQPRAAAGARPEPVPIAQAPSSARVTTDPFSGLPMVAP